MGARLTAVAGAGSAKNAHESVLGQFSTCPMFTCFISCPIIRKVWVSIKVLSAKFGFPPPPKGPKMRKNCTNQYKILKIDTFSGGGGGNAILWTKRFYGHVGVSEIKKFLGRGFGSARQKLCGEGSRIPLVRNLSVWRQCSWA